MAYDQSGLNLIGGNSLPGSGPQVWSYSSADAFATVKGAGYFNDLRDTIQVHDMIIVAGSTGGTATYTIIFVSAAPKSPLTTNVTTSALDVNAA
jgi:hypothetical protein